MTEDSSKMTAAILALGVTAATRALSAREREAIRLARLILTERLDAHRD